MFSFLLLGDLCLWILLKSVYALYTLPAKALQFWAIWMASKKRVKVHEYALGFDVLKVNYRLSFQIVLFCFTSLMLG